MKKKYSNEEVEGMKQWLLGYKGSIFSIVHRYMVKYRKEPFGKDLDEFFDRAEQLRNAVCDNPNPKVRQLYKDVINSYE